MNPDIFYRLFPLALFLILSQLYFQHYYQIDLLSIIDWWLTYSSYTNLEVPVIMGLAFTVFVFYGQIYAISRNVSALFPGKHVELIYTGSISSTEAQFSKDTTFNSTLSRLNILNNYLHIRLMIYIKQQHLLKIN